MLVKKWYRLGYLAVPLAFFLVCGRSPAQTISGEVSGTVVDSSGAVIPDAHISLISETTADRRTTTSNAAGEFVFSVVPPGTYTVTVEKEGFQTHQRRGAVLTASQRLSLGNIELAVGQVTQTIEVTAQAEAVNTENADAVGLLSNIQVTNLSVKGRDVMQLLRVLPGVSTLTVVPWGEISDTDPAGTSSNGGQFGSFTPAVGGARLFWNTVAVDGQVGSNPDFPGLFMAAISMDAVSEVKVVSNNYTADYGRNPGSTISLVSKSGTKDFHGTAYFYKRHEKLNANEFFNNAFGQPKAQYRFTTLGGALGGPIYIPNKFNANKDKVFFFYSQEEWRTKLPQGLTRVTVPTAQERIGDFSNTLDQAGNLRVVTDPTTGEPFPGNIVPSERINSNGQLLLTLMPAPNLLDRSVTEGNYNYVWEDVCDIPKRLNALKLDFHMSAKDRISFLGRRWWSDTRAYGCRTLGFWDSLPVFKHHYKYTTDTGLITWSHVFSPTVVNEFNIGIVGEKELGPATDLFGRTEETYFDPIKRSTLGFTLGQLYPQANTNNIMPQAFFWYVPSAPYLGTEQRFPANQGYTRFSFTNNLSWVRGAHTLKFGVYFERNWATDGPHADCFNGCFDFTHDVYNPYDTGWDFANALLGNFREYRESDSRRFYLMANHILEWFAQDTWKATRRLTLNLGVRFGRSTPWYPIEGLGAEWVQGRYDVTQVPSLFQPVLDGAGNRVARDPNTGQLYPAVYIGAFTGDFSFPGMVLSTDSSYPRGFRDQYPIQVSPRVGFAYDLTGDGKTAIRGGFGIYKELTPSYSVYAWSMVTNPPIQIEPHIFYGNMDTLLDRSGLLFPGGTSAIERNSKIPSVYRYSLGVQRDIGHGTVVDVSYVGNVGRHLIQNQDQNIVPYGARFLPENQDPTTGSALPDDFFRPYPGYSSIGMVMNCGISNYNALQVGVNRRFARGASFGLSYTWSHTLNTGSSEGDAIPKYRPWRAWTYGPANFDQTHMFIFNYAWDLPKLSAVAPNGVVKAVFDNWQVSGITTFASGLPQGVSFIPLLGEDTVGGGDGVRTNIIGRPQLGHGQRTFDRFFNTAAFAAPPFGDPGNAPIFPVRGPGQNNWDITFVKRIPLGGETRSLQFRAEMYNAFNHTQWSAVNTDAVFDLATGEQVNGEFGRVVGTRFSRVIQLALRLEF